MCQMCDEYENELVRMGLIEDARQFRQERQREHEKALAAARSDGDRPDPEEQEAAFTARRGETAWRQ